MLIKVVFFSTFLSIFTDPVPRSVGESLKSRSFALVKFFSTCQNSDIIHKYAFFSIAMHITVAMRLFSSALILESVPYYGQWPIMTRKVHHDWRRRAS